MSIAADELKRAVCELQGDPRAIAARFGVAVATIGRRLNGPLRDWWTAYKKRRSRRRSAMKMRRYRQKRRMLESVHQPR
jgi:hypothetical protein